MKLPEKASDNRSSRDWERFPCAKIAGAAKTKNGRSGVMLRRNKNAHCALKR
jgi:hypothetical protein